jgi:hypothetical protein
VRAFEQAKGKKYFSLIYNGKSLQKKTCHTQDTGGMLLMPLFADAISFSRQGYRQHLFNQMYQQGIK